MAQMIGFKASITIPDGAAGAQAAFSETVTVKFPAITVGKSEATPLTPATSTDYFRKYLPTLWEGGEVTVEYHYTEADYLRLIALLPEPGAVDKDFVITDPQSASPLVGTVTGFISEVGETQFVRDAVVMSSFKIHCNKFAAV